MVLWLRESILKACAEGSQSRISYPPAQKEGGASPQPAQLTLLPCLITVVGSRPARSIVPPNFKAFNLAMIQLGQIGEDKRANLVHAREMVRRAAEGGDAGPAQIVMLPVPFTFVSLPHMKGRA